MADPILFDAKGARVPSWVGDGMWRHYGPRRSIGGKLTLPSDEEWRPACMAVPTKGGWRVFGLDVGVVNGKVSRRIVDDWWRPAAAHHKRLPTVAALEMYVRMTS